MFGASLRLGLLLAVTVFLSSRGIVARVEVASPLLSARDTFVREGDGWVLASGLEVPINRSYCFQFTWLGPRWDNTSQLNKTCKDFSARPCKEPLVITHDASPPNTTYMWDNFDRDQISCKLTRGEACTKWVNYYANEIENITYMCSKYTVEGAPKINWQGCMLQEINATSTEVCACRSKPGDLKPPCNAGPSTLPQGPLVLLGALLLVLLALVGRHSDRH